MELLFIASGAVLLAGCLVCVGIGPRRPCDVVTGSVAVTLAIVVLLGKVLLLLGIFRPVPVTIAAIACAGAAGCWLVASPAAAARARASRKTLVLRPRLRFSLVGCVAAATALALVGYEALMGARLPPIAYDAVYYHLISVAEWVRTGHLVAPLPGLSSHNPVYSYYDADSAPKDLELTAAWFGVFTHNTSLVGLAQVVYVPLFFGGVYGICRHLDIRPSLALLAAALVTLTPAVVRELGTDYVDVAAAGSVLAAWQFLVSAFPATAPDEDPNAPKVRSLVLAGICFALAAGITPWDLGYCAAGLLLTVGLCIRDTRRRVRAAAPRLLSAPELPHPGRCLMAIVIPMIGLGSFWYIRTWLVWGSPLWPVQIGPFAGVTTANAAANVSGLAIPPHLRNSSGLVLLVRSWLTPGLSLGNVWLWVLLPAVALAVVIGIRRRRLMPVTAVVAPLFLLCALGPGSWQVRFELPLVASGAIALALVCEAVSLRQHAVIAWRACATAISATALALAGSMAWGTANAMSGWQAAPDVRATLRLMNMPPTDRLDDHFWQPYNAMNAAMTRPGAIAFFANGAPNVALPYAGLDFSRAVVVLRPYTGSVVLTVAGRPARRTGRTGAKDAARSAKASAAEHFQPIVGQMRSLGATYLFVPPVSPAYRYLVTHTPAQLRLVFKLAAGVVFELRP